MATSVFADIQGRSFPYIYHGRIHVDTLVGGTPSDENVAKGWLETKLKGVTSDEQIQRMVTETMLERKVTADEALEIVNKLKNLSGFKRTETGLYYEGRQLKAALKEAVSVAVSVNKIKQQGWGQTRKWISGFFPEHVFIRENKLHLLTDDGFGNMTPVTEASGVLQQFVHTRFGSSIQYQEYVTDAEFEFTVVADYLFTDHDWAMIWSTGEWNGLGASRSQGYGTYSVVKWEKDFTKAAEEDLRRLEEQVNEQPTGDDDGAIATVVRTKRKKAA